MVVIYKHKTYRNGYMKVGDYVNRKLKAARAENGLTQIELAKLIEMPISTYRRKESGESEFTVNEALKISKVLNKSLEEIFFYN